MPDPRTRPVFNSFAAEEGYDAEFEAEESLMRDIETDDDDAKGGAA